MSVGVPDLVNEASSRGEEIVQVARGFGPYGAQPRAIKELGFVLSSTTIL